MQSPSWYWHRLRSMSPAELVWRINSLARDIGDRPRISFGMYPGAKKLLPADSSPEFLSDLDINPWAKEQITQKVYSKQKKEQLLSAADKILQHKLSYFNLHDQHLGKEIDWHTDFYSNVTAPVIFSALIDYRDVKRSGDCKLVWEPNRHHQFVVLGRAYRISEDKKYARALVEQMLHWIKMNPFGKGMNWRSPLELGVRLINWTWALDLIKDADVIAPHERSSIIHNIYLMIWDTRRKYSQASSANNHLVGEAAGIAVATAYFNFLPDASEWFDEAREILEREIVKQSYDDGCTREHASGYQLFVLQLFFTAGWLGKLRGRDFSAQYWKRFEKMLEFVALLAEAGGEYPKFGDCDDAYVLNLGDSHLNPTGLVNLGAILFQRADLYTMSPALSETAFWLLGPQGVKKSAELAEKHAVIKSHGFTDSGYYLLQHGKDIKDSVSLLIDCAELGYGPIAAHGHADALSFTLRLNGKDILIDPGTYDYFTFPEWRKYFKSTAAHNTIEIDGINQSEILGPFLWGQRANSICLDWKPSRFGGFFHGQHDGYAKLTGGPIHGRKLKLNGEKKLLEISDNIETYGRHQLKWHFHFAEDCIVKIEDNNQVVVKSGKDHLTLQFPESLGLSLYRGENGHQLGWRSTIYHQKVSITTLVAETKIDETSTFDIRLHW